MQVIHSSEEGGAAPMSSGLDFRRLLDNLPAVAYTCDAEGLITYYNRRAVELWGREPKLNDAEDRFCGSLRLFSPESTPVSHDQSWMALALRDGQESNGREIIIERPDGSRRIATAHANLIHDDQGRLLGAVNVLVDITDSKHKEQAFRVREQQLRLVTEHAPMLLAHYDREGRYKFVNQGYAERFGLTSEEVLGKHISEAVGEEAYTKLRPYVEAALAGAYVEFEVELPYSGTGAWCMSCAYTPEFGPDGAVSGMIAAITDATDRKRTEESLQEMNLALAHAMPGISLLNPDGRYLSVNRAYAEMVGCQPDEMIGADWTPSVHPEDREQAFTAYQQMLREGRCEFEARAVRKDGAVVHKHVLMVKRMGEDGSFLGHHCFMRDITERKLAEVQLRERAEEIEKLMDVMPVAVWIARDPECTVITGNQAGHAMLRLPGGANLSKSAPDPDRPQHFRVYHQGTELSPEELPMQYAAAHGVEVRGFEEELVFDDGRITHVYGSATPLRDEHGKVRGCVAAFMDVSELTRLRDELRQQAEELAQADRKKDEFLATLAHELRNPLAPLRNGLELLKWANGDVAAVENARALMERQLQQMVRLVDDLLEISRISTGRLQLHKEHVEIAAVLNTAMETARPLIETAQHQLTVTMPSQPLYLEADPFRLSQVFCNLLNNAAKFTEAGGRIWVTAEQQNGEVVVTVRDTGIGIPDQHLPHVFEMFSQATPALERSQGGLGIGLALVRGLVEMHGGSVEALSGGIGLGSKFTVRLPILDVPMATDALKGERLVTGSVKRRSILVADDNRDTVESMRELLELMDNEVHTAHDGLQAVQAASVFRPDVVLLDIGMPRMNGYEAARRIREAPWGKNMVLIALTGWGQDGDKQKAREAGFDHHLTKPIDPAVLATLAPGPNREPNPDLTL